jgi:hypothetical protein
MVEEEQNQKSIVLIYLMVHLVLLLIFSMMMMMIQRMKNLKLNKLSTGKHLMIISEQYRTVLNTV